MCQDLPLTRSIFYKVNSVKAAESNVQFMTHVYDRK